MTIRGRVLPKLLFATMYGLSSAGNSIVGLHEPFRGAFSTCFLNAPVRHVQGDVGRCSLRDAVWQATSRSGGWAVKRRPVREGLIRRSSGSRAAAQPVAAGEAPFLVAPGTATGRQWNGKPVSDTVLLHPHTDIAHRYWKSVIQQGDTTVDATCGNGNDTLEMVRQLAMAGGGRVVACDIQEVAFVKSRALLEAKLAGLMNMGVRQNGVWALVPTEEGRLRGMRGDVEVDWVLRSHVDVLGELEQGSVRLVAFNLGYLPGGDKSIVTLTNTTLCATKLAMDAVKQFGCVSLTCYTGHDEGLREEVALLDYVRKLPQEHWSAYVFEWANQRNKRNGIRAPTLVLLQKLSDNLLEGEEEKNSASQQSRRS